MKAKKRPAKRVKAGTSKTSAAQRRALFIEAYVENGGNGKRAAITAGFSTKTAESQASRLLRNVKVAAEIEKRNAAALDRAQKITGVTVERTLREVGRLAYSDTRKFFKQDGTLLPLHELDDDTAATIASIEVDEIKADGAVIGVTRKLKIWDKNAALEKGMKHLGLFKKDNEQTPPAVVVRGVRSVAFDPFRGRGAAK